MDKDISEWESLSDVEKKQIGMWCDFCGKKHPGMCKKIEEFYDSDMESQITYLI
jgi:hypothetical protein